MERDWLQLAVRPESLERLASWKQIEPELNDFQSPAELVLTIASAGLPERSCRLVSGLLVVALEDAFAAYTVLIALIPGLLVAAGRRWQAGRYKGPWQSRAEVDVDAISAAWEAINLHAGQRHERPARLIVRRVELQLRTVHAAYHRRVSRSVSESGTRLVGGDLYLAEQDTGDNLFALSILEALRSGRLDPTTVDLVYRVAVLDQRLTTTARRHGLDHRQTLGALRLALRLISADESALTTPAIPQEAQHMVHRSQHHDNRDLHRSETPLPVMPMLLTVKQAADLLGMGRSTIYELIDAGELGSVKRGASRRIPLKAIHEYIDSLLDDRSDGNEKGSAGRPASWDRSVARGS
jgi:excisionase family DNA binding protein